MPSSPIPLSSFLDHGVGAGGARSYLRRVQARLHWVPREAVELAAEHYGVGFAGLYEAVAFDPGFSLEPRGERVFELCQGLACREAGSDHLLAELERRCGLKRGQTAADASASLLVTTCQGRCAIGINAALNGVRRSNLDVASAEALTGWLQSGKQD